MNEAMDASGGTGGVDEAGPLSFEVWLSISPRLLRRKADERRDILKAENVEPQVWDEAERHWSLTLAQAIGEGDFGKAAAYGAACAKELNARGRGGGAAAPVVMARTRLSSNTAIGPIAASAALPFAPGGSAEEALRRARQVGSADEGRGAAVAPIGVTAAVDVAALARRVLAFGPPRMTWSNGAGGADGGRGGTLPWGTPSAALGMSQTALTVEQYASLCVDLELRPLDTTAVLRRYGITAEHKRAVDEDWAQIFAAQPARRATFEHARSAYRTWCAQGGRQ